MTFCKISHSCQRGPNPPILRRPLLYCLPPFFPILSNPNPPFTLPVYSTPIPPPPAPNALSIFLFLWLNGWSHHIWCAILLNDIMDLHISSLSTFVPEGPWCVFYATRHQFSDLISHTQTHKHTNTQYTQGPVDYTPI